MAFAVVGLHRDDHALFQFHRVFQRETPLDHGPLPQAYAQAVGKGQTKGLSLILEAPVAAVRPSVDHVCRGIAHAAFVDTCQQHLIGTVIHPPGLIRGLAAAQCPVIAGMIAIVQCTDVREHHVLRLNHPVRGQMGMGVSPGTGCHLNIVDPLRAQPVQFRGGRRLQLILLGAGMQGTSHLIERRVHAGRRLHHDLDLVFVLDLPGRAHDLLTVSQLIAALGQLHHQLSVDLIHADGCLWVQMVFLHHHPQVRLELVQVTAVHAPTGRQSAEHGGVGRIGTVLDPGAVEPFIGHLGTEAEDIGFTATGDNSVPPHIVHLRRGHRRGSGVPFILRCKQDQAGKVCFRQIFLNPRLPVFPHPCKVDPVFIVYLHCAFCTKNHRIFLLFIWCVAGFPASSARNSFGIPKVYY